MSNLTQSSFDYQKAKKFYRTLTLRERVELQRREDLQKHAEKALIRKMQKWTEEIGAEEEPEAVQLSLF